jgi:pyrimidine-nucleoside phosphorylase
MLLVGGVERRADAARRRLEAALASGAGLERLARMVRAHGGDVRMVTEPARLPRARQRVPVTASLAGIVQRIEPYELGRVAVALGAGRARAEDVIDPAVGIELAVRRGSRVARGEPLAWLHVQSRRGIAALLERTRAAFAVGTRPARTPPLVIERISPAGIYRPGF